MAMIRGQAPEPAPSQAPARVVVKLARPAGGPGSFSGAAVEQGLRQLLPERNVRPYFSQPAAFAAAATPAERELQDYLALDAASPEDGAALASTLNARPDVERAFLEAGPTPPPAGPAGSNPRAANQGYLEAAPKGVDARWAWANAAGAAVGFVDLEQGWTLAHEDLKGAAITLISGVSKDYPGHGTAVLGQVAAVDNALGVVGIAFQGRTRVVSQWRGPSAWDTAGAILDAAQAMAPGDVLLLEAQTRYPTSGAAFVPVEVEDPVFAAIRVAVERGVVVVEAGGNGGVDLDGFRSVDGKAILNRQSPDFRDSGAILVGAASSGAPHRRMSWSNHGSRIDCYAWGENIETCGDGWTGTGTSTYTSHFGGTSGASPIVTGAALLVQAWARSSGRTYTPAQIRALLSDAGLNTASAQPAQDRIGVMPNLKAILLQEQASAPPATASATT